MDLLGVSLLHWADNNKNNLTIPVISSLAKQMISVVEFVHSKGIIHRDIKPENFVFGYSGENNLYLIDFGLAWRYKDTDGHHISWRTRQEEEEFEFGSSFASINVRKKIEPNRRDDLESVGYVLIYLLAGNLPWQLLEGDEQLMKQVNDYPTLCNGQPTHFKSYLDYCRGLGFEDTPDYKYLCSLFD